MLNKVGIQYIKRDFNTEWLWVMQNEPNIRVCFRAFKTLENAPESAPAYISAETRFRVWVNGQPLVYEGGTHRESLPGCGYYHTLELAPFLKIGQNLIAVEVWYWGNEGRNNTNSGAGGLLFDCPSLSLQSDDWKVRVNPACREVTPPKTAYLYGGYDTGWDAAADIGAWMMPDYDDSDFVPAITKGKVPCQPWGTLYESPIPLMQFTEIKPYKALKESNGTVEAVLPYAAHLTPWFRVEAEAGKTVEIHTDRWEVHGGPGDEHHTYRAHKIEYITRAGIQEFEPFDWFFGESVFYHLPKGVRLIEAGWRESGYPAHMSGLFSSSDKNLDRLVEKAARTLYVCMRENYMDCPDRERGQWIGDVSSQIPQTFYALDRNVDRLTSKAIGDFISLRKGDILVGNVPGRNAGELPSQSLNAISDIGMVMTYAWFSGELEVLAFAYPAIKTYLSLWEINEDGTLTPRKGNWQWYDHKEGIDGEVLEYCWYLLGLMGAKRMAAYTAPEDAAAYEAKITTLRHTANRLYWDGAGHRSKTYAVAMGEGIYDDRAQAMAILSGIATGPQIEQAADILKTACFSTPYMEYYVLKALFAAGRDKQAVARMMKRYAPLIENENTTLWEDFEILGTRNHAWTGGPLTIAYQHLAGISPLTPGFEKILIAPSPAAPNQMTVSVHSPAGEIKLSVDRSIGHYRLTAVIPKNCSAVIGLPISALPTQYKLILGDSVSQVESGAFGEDLPLESGAFSEDLPLCTRCVPKTGFLLFTSDTETITIEAKAD